MTKLRPLARLTYATAFFAPFFWAATGHPVPLFDAVQTATSPNALQKETRFATLTDVTDTAIIITAQ